MSENAHDSEDFELADDPLAEAMGIAFRANPLGSPPTRSVDPIATQVGRYKLLEQIGEGGFGVVYMAQQEEPIRRRVALKIIKLGMDTQQVIARFEAERQALALMSHENIAGVLDAGATETGRPYFVMELVRGVPITEYCDRNKLNTNDRLKLFISVCKAVQHAHQKGIIHRDLKPNNVLVTLRDGVAVPKVIDFGIAKATQAKLTEKTLFTRFGQFVGTPAYTSPEQIEMSELDADTRSDIYSLGVLLYELLTGTTPIEQEKLRRANYLDLQRMICDQEPPKPSARLSQSGEALATICAQRSTEPGKLGQLLRGELDWIVMKALEKDRTRRYDTAIGLAADVQRYLNDEPVQAGPPSTSYRLRKFVHRNFKLVVTTAAFILLLVMGTAFSTLQAVRASKAEKLAQTERNAATDARDKLLEEQERAAAANQRRQISRVAALLAATPESVPVVIDEIRASHENVLPLISRQMNESVRFDDRLRLAVARTLLGDPLPQFLVDSVPQVQAKECANLLQAIRECRQQSIPLLLERFTKTDTVQARFRLAVLLLDMGNRRPTAELLALKKDPATRTAFIHSFQDWHGDLAAVPEALMDFEAPALQSGLAAAVGRLNPNAVAAAVRDDIVKSLLEVFRAADDGGAHSASAWALQRWGVLLPEITANSSKPKQHWYVTGTGLTMLVLGGESKLEDPSDAAKAFPWRYAISDKEIPVSLFRRFLSDPNCPADGKPNDWPDVDRKLVPSDDCPVHNVSHSDCLMFCNWLSRVDGLQPCYERAEAGEWFCHFDRNGYRLPCADEWDHACYAGATSHFPFGEDALLLPEYGNLLLRRTQPCGRYLPNNWGLFDMFGNVWDNCHQAGVFEIASSPRQSSQPKLLMIRGATFGSGSYYSNRGRYGSSGVRSPDAGLRVVRRVGTDSIQTPITRESILSWYDSQLVVNPQSIEFHVRHGHLLIELQRWKDAASDYQFITGQQPRDLNAWLIVAALLAESEDRDAFLRHCRSMLQAFRETTDPSVAEKICKSCLLLPGIQDAAIAPLADLANGAAIPDSAKAYAQTTRALAYYRSGNHQTAIELSEGIREQISDQPFLRELNLSILAMAYHASGHNEQAAALLNQDFGKLNQTVPDSLNTPSQNWHNLLTSHVIYREARKVVFSK